MPARAPVLEPIELPPGFIAEAARTSPLLVSRDATVSCFWRKLPLSFADFPGSRLLEVVVDVATELDPARSAGTRGVDGLDRTVELDELTRGISLAVLDRVVAGAELTRGAVTLGVELVGCDEPLRGAATVAPADGLDELLRGTATVDPEDAGPDELPRGADMLGPEPEEREGAEPLLRALEPALWELEPPLCEPPARGLDAPDELPPPPPPPPPCLSPAEAAGEPLQTTTIAAVKTAAPC